MAANPDAAATNVRSQTGSAAPDDLERTGTGALLVLLRLALMSAAAAAGTVSWRCWNTLGSGHWTSTDLTPLKLGVVGLVAAIVAVASVPALAVGWPRGKRPRAAE